MDSILLGTDPIAWRGAERIVIVIGATIMGYLGYRLYIHGIDGGKFDTKVKSAFMRFTLSGAGPGIVFMSFSSFVLVAALFTGGASHDNSFDEIKAVGKGGRVKIDRASIGWKFDPNQEEFQGTPAGEQVE